VIEAALSSCFRHSEKDLDVQGDGGALLPPIAEAKAIPTGTMKLRLALARQPLEPARTEVRLVEAGSDKRNGALVTRDFAIRHRLRRVVR
jgi:hypothetical protein